MNERSLAPSVAPELVVTVDGAGRTLEAALYRVGRDPEADIAVTDPRVSWNHAVLQAEGDVWFVEDCGSRNGTFVGSDRVGPFEINGRCTVRLGSADDGPAPICSVSPPPCRPAGRDAAFRAASAPRWHRPCRFIDTPIRNGNNLVWGGIMIARYLIIEPFGPGFS